MNSLRGWSPSLASGIRYPLAGGLGMGLGALVLLVVLGGEYNGAIFVLALCYGFVTLGMAVQLGYANQLVLSQSVFMGIGAYGVAILNTRYGMGVPLAMLIMTVGAALLSCVLGAVIIRATGLAIALATLFLSVILSSVIVYSSYFGASQGFGGIASIVNSSSITDTTLYSGMVAAVLLGVCVFICARVLRSGIGLELALLGADHRMADAVGIRTGRRKLELFVLGSVLAAIGGTVFGGTQQFVSPGNFDQSAELTLLVMLFLGGRRSIYGAVLGTVAFEFLSSESNYVSSHLLTIEGILFTVVLLLTPDGLLGVAVNGTRGVARLLTRRRPDAAPAVMPPAGPPDAPAGAVAPIQVSPPRAPSAQEPADAPYALEVHELTKRFGGVVAVDHASLRIHPSGIHALIGPNGAGKTTLLELIAGGIRPDHGRVLLFGHDVTRARVAERAKLGMARTFQAVRLVPSLTALDNVAVAALDSHDTWLTRSIVKSELGEARDRARDRLAEFGIGPLALRKPGELTLEGQRMVEFARALVANPRLLVLDEPASGLSIEQRERLSETLARLGERLTVVLVEHDLVMIERIAQHVIVLIDGRVAYDGQATAFRHQPEVRARLLGLVDPVELAAVESNRS
jgi:branched-chain amino acid transport system permease protein